jgi:glycoside/pentoside/hexuronide:cation symporter, GPH family
MPTELSRMSLVTARASSFVITRTRRIGNATGSIGAAALTTVPPLLLLYYLTEICGVPPALAGIGLFIPQLFDFVLSPAFGVLSDRTKSRWGTRRPYMLVGSIASALATAALFSAPEKMGPDASLIYTAVAYCFVVIASIFFALPHLAMAAELSDDPPTREQIVATRMAFIMVGILVSGALSRPLVGLLGGGREGFAMMSIVLGVVCGFTMLISWRVTRGAPILIKEAPTEALPFRLFDILSSRTFVILSIAYVFQIIGASSSLGAWPYFADFVLHDGNAVAWLFGTAMIASIITLPF